MSFFQRKSTAKEPFSVQKFNQQLYDSVEFTFPNDIWIKAELESMTVSRSGHAYIDLTDEVEDINTQAIIYSGQLKKIQSKLIASGAMELQEGHVFTFKGKVGVYVRGGKVQLNINDVDVSHALGEKAILKQKLIEMLKKTGEIDINKQLPLPTFPLSIALFTAKNSAACADFCDEIDRSGIGFNVDLYGIPVQGATAPVTISKKIANVTHTVGSWEKYDLAVMIRGGGSQNDLSAFDSEIVVKAVVNSELPFFVGIGHEIDTSVVDLVANSSYKTPTATAQAIVEGVRFEWELRTNKIHDYFQTIRIGLEEQKSILAQNSQQLTYRLKAAMASSNHKLESYATQISHVKGVLKNQHNLLKQKQTDIALSFKHLEKRENEQLLNKVERLKQVSKQLLSHIEKLEHKKDLVKLSDPKLVLKRGFALVKTNNSYQPNASKIELNQELEIIMQDGKIAASVKKIKIDKEDNE